jgi:hypothetical protein
MDGFRPAVRVLAVFSGAAGLLLLLNGQEYVVPASGQSLSRPCAFAFWTLAVIFWAMDHGESNT